MANKNWRDQQTVRVGWVMRPELNGIDCEVVENWPNPVGSYREPHSAKSVQYCKGKVNRVVWNHTQERYVFAQ